MTGGEDALLRLAVIRHGECLHDSLENLDRCVVPTATCDAIVFSLISRVARPSPSGMRASSRLVPGSQQQLATNTSLAVVVAA
jgi:hypothetical protein